MSDIGSYAMIKNDSVLVENIILADSSFKISGYYFISYDPNTVFCEPGMYYNSANDMFYDDEAFTKIDGIGQ